MVIPCSLPKRDKQTPFYARFHDLYQSTSSEKGGSTPAVPTAIPKVRIYPVALRVRQYQYGYGMPSLVVSTHFTPETRVVGGDMTIHPPSRVTYRYALLVWLAVPCVVLSTSSSSSLDPLLLRVARGESTNNDDDRTPVWMMRQAGRHMAVYRALCKRHPTSFRERSETHELSVEISCQPVDACEYERWTDSDDMFYYL